MQLRPVRLSFINPHHKPTCAPFDGVVCKSAPLKAQNENRKKRNTVQLIKGSYFPSTYWTDLLQIPGPNSIRSSTLKRKNVKNLTKNSPGSIQWLLPGDGFHEMWREVPRSAGAGAFSLLLRHVSAASASRNQALYSVFWWEDRKLSQTHSLPLS